MTLLQQVDTVRAPDGAFTFKAAITAPDGDELKLFVRVADRVRSLVRYTRARRAAPAAPCCSSSATCGCTYPAPVRS